jgi:hypothetical protein
MEARWTRDATDVVEVGDVRVTSPVPTAVELAMQLPRPFALSAVDAFLRSGKTDRWILRAAKAKRSSGTPIAVPLPPRRW